MSRQTAIQQLNQIPIHIATPDFSADILRWGLLENEWWRNYLHVHSYYEICYAFAGYGTFLIDGALHTVQAGDVFIARPNQYHEIISSEAAPLGLFHWSYTLAIHETATDTARLLGAFVESSACISQRIAHIPILFELLLDEVQRHEAGFLPAIHALTTKLILETARSIAHIPADATFDGDPQSQVVRDIIRYMKDNLQHPIQIRDIAAQVHLSERHVSRLFLEATQKTLKTYLTDLRLEKARQLLLKDDLPIGEIALLTGYPDGRYFSTIFRKHLGMTPSAFRMQRGTQFVE